jgi:hypothetical protein
MRKKFLALGISVAAVVATASSMAAPAFAGVTNHTTGQGSITAGGSGSPFGHGASTGSNPNGPFIQGGVGRGGLPGGGGCHDSSPSGVVGGSSPNLTLECSIE